MKTELRRGVAALLTLCLVTSTSACGSGAVPAAEAATMPPQAAAPAVERERPECRVSAYHPELAEAMEGVEGAVDCSALSEGYVALSVTDGKRLKFRVTKGEESCTYDLPGDGTPTVYPMNLREGRYTFELMRCISGTKYARVWTDTREVALEDEFSPWLLPSQMVPYDADSECVEKAWRQLQSAVIYPVVLLLMMSLVLAVMVSLVLPVFVEVYESMTGVLASSSFGYIRFANAVSWVSLITVGLISTAVLACFVLRRGEKGQQVLNRLLQRLPMTREAMLELELSRFFDVLATFLSSGMDVDLAMEEASEVLTEPTLTEKALEARRSMAAGESLGKALYGMGALNALYARMILSAERTGQMEPTMARLADTVGEDANLRIQGLISAVEPLLTVFLTASVGVTLLSVMLPLAGMLSAIG